jgi:hypothetical protein
MGNRRRVAERNAGAFLGPDLLAATPMNALNLGPGQPGPADDWRLPSEPPDEKVSREDATVESAPAAPAAQATPHGSPAAPIDSEIVVPAGG